MTRWQAKVSVCLDIHINAFFSHPYCSTISLANTFFPPLSPLMLRCIVSRTLSSRHRTPPLLVINMSPRPRVEVDPLILTSSIVLCSYVHGLSLPRHTGKCSAPLQHGILSVAAEAHVKDTITWLNIFLLSRFSQCLVNLKI